MLQTREILKKENQKMKEINKEIEEIKESELFDENYYLMKNPDVKKSRLNPIEHYLLHGAKEERNPSPNFNTSFYLSSNPDVKKSGFNPLIHYIRHGKNEGRSPCRPKYFLTLAACIKNEGRYLNEWLAYYIYQGVEHFYLHDDESIDNTQEILKPYIKHGYVTLYKGLRKEKILQAEFYDKIVQEKKYETEWCCFFDADEFFQGKYKLKDFLLSVQNTKISGIELFWKMFGSADLERYDDRFVIERFTKHRPIDFSSQEFVKSICRLRNTKGNASNHCFHYECGIVVNSLLQDITDTTWGVRTGGLKPIWENYWINHYFFKSREEYLAKIKRGSAATGSATRPNFFDTSGNNNELTDESMKKYIEPVKKIIADITYEK